MKWIKANMPWSDSGAHDYNTMPDEPNLDDKIKEKFGMTETEAFQKYMLDRKTPITDRCPEYDEIEKKISDWKWEQPEYKEWDKLCNEWEEEQEQIKKDNPTFEGSGLNNTGTLVKLEDDSVYLIGDINRHCGICDDCVRFGNKTIIKEYAIIYEKPL